VEDHWARFRGATRARIGLGRAGDGLTTRDLLDFQLAHARARDAVHSVPDFARLVAELGETVEVRSAAGDRAEYLRRPDLGRRLSLESRNALPSGPWDLVIVVADGLSAIAVNDHAVATVSAVRGLLPDWQIGPIVMARNARVALGDEIGAAMGARLCAVLIGERPGLTVANSLGIYLTWEPRRGRKDAERNCISNIHGDGLSYRQAAEKLVWLAREARLRGLTGVMLKEALPGGEDPSSALQ